MLFWLRDITVLHAAPHFITDVCIELYMTELQCKNPMANLLREERIPDAE